MTTPIDTLSTASLQEFPPPDNAREPELDYKLLISPGIKHILATKLNNFTGGKFKCLRNWQESSGQALFDAIKKVYGEKIFDEASKSIRETVNGFVNPMLTSTQKWLGNNGKVLKFLTEQTGVDQAIKTCRKFTEVCCLLLEQREAGTTQNIDRLLTIVGVTYSGNDNVKDIVDGILDSYSKKFFEKVLPQMIRENCGRFAGPVEKLVVTLGIKNTVDCFLKERILQDQSVEKVLEKGDVYQKLILKGVSQFIDIKDQRVQALKMEDLLRDKTLNGGVRMQLKRLQRYYNDSRLTNFVVGAGYTLINRILERIKDKNVAEVPQEELVKILVDSAAFEGAYDAVNAVVTVATTATEVGGYIKDRAEKAINRVADTVEDGIAFVKSFFGLEEKEKELEDDYGKCLQALFSERSVERKFEESTGVGGTILNGAAIAGKAVLNRAVAVAPAIGKVALGTAEVGGKILLGCAKGLGWGLGKLAVGIYNMATGSSSKSEDGAK